MNNEEEKIISRIELVFLVITAIGFGATMAFGNHLWSDIAATSGTIELLAFSVVMIWRSIWMEQNTKLSHMIMISVMIALAIFIIVNWRLWELL